MTKKEWIDAKLKIVKELEILTDEEVIIQEHLINDNYLVPHDNLIFLCSRQNFNSRINSLLHEAGHVIIFHLSDRDFTDSQKGITNEYKIDFLQQEILAWNYGYELSNSLDLDIDYDLFNKHARKHLLEYIRWVEL